VGSFFPRETPIRSHNAADDDCAKVELFHVDAYPCTEIWEAIVECFGVPATANMTEPHAQIHLFFLQILCRLLLEKKKTTKAYQVLVINHKLLLVLVIS